MASDERILNEIRHGEYIKEHGEEIWNWSSPAGKLRWARRCRLFTEFLGNNKSRVLEIGCGTGLFTKELARTDNTIAAIDISDSLIMKARERISSANVSFVVGNAYKTEFQPGTFDFIVGSSSLHHLDVDLALKEFYRILKGGGRIMFTEPNMLNPQVALIKNIPFLKRRAGDSLNETAFVRWQIAKKLHSHSFVDISVKPFDFMHPQLPASFLDMAVRVTTILEKMSLVSEIAGSLIIQCRKN
ncbi:MAG: class I SAM-dependent methyltransferase [Deltaproteobacteria bacterium]|nr:class I SAM-dependent methyltransferase [Deltaproteobacteria bacterium]MCX5855415.1 class I SAM-dependent methyltransferase [Deltaproteobacteria bacterium]